MERTTDSIQGLLVFSRRGGKRKGAGRKPKGPRPGVPHERREDVPSSAPIHVTVTVCKGVPNLRSRKAVRVVKTCIQLAKERLGVRLLDPGEPHPPDRGGAKPLRALPRDEGFLGAHRQAAESRLRAARAGVLRPLPRPRAAHAARGPSCRSLRHGEQPHPRRATRRTVVPRRRSLRRWPLPEALPRRLSRARGGAPHVHVAPGVATALDSSLEAPNHGPSRHRPLTPAPPLRRSRARRRPLPPDDPSPRRTPGPRRLSGPIGGPMGALMVARTGSVAR